MNTDTIIKYYDDHLMLMENVKEDRLLIPQAINIEIGFNFINKVDFFNISDDLENMLTMCSNYVDACHFIGCSWEDDDYEENEFKEYINNRYKTDKDINFVVSFKPYHIFDINDEKIDKFRNKIINYLRAKDNEN